MDQAKEIRAGEEIDLTKLEPYLRDKLDEDKATLVVSQFHGGHANLTYLFRFGQNEYVLRRPPFGKIAPGAHDMKREYRVLSKLNSHFPPAPRAYDFCEDLSIIGAPFVVMERRTGEVVRYKVPAVFKGFDNIEERLTIAMIKCEARLHSVDVKAADLLDLGKPDGYVERQLSGGSKRWSMAQTEDNRHMMETYKILSSDIPTPQAVSIVHNDIKFDNCQFQENNPDKVTSIFDWDMTTLGDPLADFGISLSYWPDERLLRFKNLPVSLKGNFPSKDFLKKKYAEYSGFDLSRMAWYESLAYWKGAIIAQQLYKRFVDGATQDKRMIGFGESAKALAETARDIARAL